MQLGLSLGLTRLGGSSDNTLSRIAAAIAAGGLPPTMSSPPTGSRGTDGAASTINAAAWNLPSILLTDSRLRITGPIAPVHPTDDTPTSKLGYGASWCSYAGGVYSGGNGWEVAFNATGLSAFDISCSGFGPDAAYSFRVLVDDQVISTSDTQLTPPSFSGVYYKITFSAAGTHRIRIIGSKNATFSGINVNAGAVVSAPTVASSEVKMVAFGDSFVADSNLQTSNSIGTWSARLSFLMGARFYPMGRSGQGYALAVDGRTIDQRIPLDGPRIDTPDLVFLNGSVNDFQQTPATFQANIANGVTQARLLWPKAWIIVLSSFSSTNAPINATRNAAYYNGAVSAADSKTIVIDTNAIPLAIAQTTGTLPNSTSHDSPEGVHWGPNEIAYNVGLIFAEVSTRLQQAAAAQAMTPGWVSINDKMAFDFMADRGYVSGVAQASSTSALTTVRASQGYDLAATTLFANNTARRTSAGLLVEPSATNLVLQSDFVSGWTTANVGLTAAQSAAPDGTTTMALLAGNGGGTNPFVFRNVTLVNGQTYTYSEIAKAGTSSYAWLDAGDGAHDISAKWNLSTGAYVGTRVDAGSPQAPTATSITDLTGGFFRASMTFTSGGTGGTFAAIVGVGDTAGLSFGESTTKNISIGKFQIETGSKATSYIPSGASQGTRAADAVSLPTLPTGTTSILYTFDDGSQQTASVSAGAYAIPTNLNRSLIGRMSVR